MKGRQLPEVGGSGHLSGVERAETEGLPVEELFLLHLRYKEAQMVESGGNHPILLDDPTHCWVVYTGWADLFAVSLENGKVAGARTHLFRAEAGQALFGMDLDAEQQQVGLLLVGGEQTRLLRLSTERLYRLSQDSEFRQPVTTLLDNWVRNLSTCLLDTLPPKDCLRLDAGPSIYIEKASNVCARRGVLWVKHDCGHSHFTGTGQLPLLNGKVRWPISERAWIQTAENSQLDLIDTHTFLAQAVPWADLADFQRYMLQNITQWLEHTRRYEIKRLQTKQLSDQSIISDALTRLAGPFLAPTAPAASKLDEDSLLLQACAVVGAQLGIQITAPPKLIQQGQDISLADVARASHIQTRQVALKGEWWQEDNGPLLGFWEETDQPIALISSKRGYRLYDAGTRLYREVTAEVAERIKPFAHMLYRSLPNKPVSAWELIKFGLAGDATDLRLILFAGVAVGLLGMLIPITTAIIFDQIIPQADRLQLFQLAFSLIFVVLAMALFQVVQNLALLRLQERMGAELEAAIWQRVLSLPVSFFRDYTSGDLGNRVLGLRRIQQILSGTVMSALLAGIFSIFSFFLLFYYHSRLAWTATGLVAVSVAVMIFAGYRKMDYYRQLVHLQGKISGIILQTIEGITKFRAAAAEGRAFATWAAEFSQAKQVSYRARDVANNLQVFNSGYQVITTMVIFTVIILSGRQELTIGQFLAFNTAFIQFMMAVLTLSGAFLTILNVIPMYERARPILQAAPEIDELKEHPGDLVGGIEVAHVSFRYKQDGPMILKDVSLEIYPGEFVALVGASGSGKSTLFRLLIGFEQPLSGSIYYNGRDLAAVDVREVRRQIGVVLQNGKVMGGDLFTNIVGSLPLTLDDAWRAAEMAGLADDIKKMPMGMHTVLNNGGGTLSGGQRQRLLIARAIVNRPRILFFDEATSALDNHTQAVVSQSLANLQATRIVIAHRLSTIKNADKIYVLQDGRIAQEGTYDELINVEGLFADLAKRQMV
jgi:NHLM bacteriocin system ABC transporter ATP-binding protein